MESVITAVESNIKSIEFSIKYNKEQIDNYTKTKEAKEAELIKAQDDYSKLKEKLGIK